MDEGGGQNESLADDPVGADVVLDAVAQSLLVSRRVGGEAEAVDRRSRAVPLRVGMVMGSLLFRGLHDD